MLLYDSVDESILKSYAEFSLAAMIYGTMKDSAASEQASRMTAMDSASKNAGKESGSHIFSSPFYTEVVSCNMLLLNCHFTMCVNSFLTDFVCTL